jgi:hypothetical protein
MTLDEGAKILAAIFGIIALFFTAFQIRANTKQRRAQCVGDFLKSFWNDPDIVEAYYMVEYDEFQYSSDFHGSDVEKKIDRLLECFGSIAKLYRANLISIEDISLLRYEYLIVYQNEHIRSYVGFLDKWYAMRGIKGRPFDEFRHVGDTLEKLHYTG